MYLVSLSLFCQSELTLCAISILKVTSYLLFTVVEFVLRASSDKTSWQGDASMGRAESSARVV